MVPLPAPMLATLARELPAGEWCYEPKWDGFRCIAARAGDEVTLVSRNGRPLARYFPEVVEGLLAVPERDLVLDGELVADRFDDLMLRLHPSQSRVERLRAETPARYVAFDLLAAGDDLAAAPYAERRAALAAVLADPPPPVALTLCTADPAVAERWLGGAPAGIDGVVAKRPGSPYEAGRRSRHWVKVKPLRTADCVAAGARLELDGSGVASLLLGVYDGAGALRHTGVASSFPAALRRLLLDDVGPYATGLAGHPWEHGYAMERGPIGRLKGAAGSWNPGTMVLDWVPLRPELVCEVAYDRVEPNGRWRHPARFVRWRPDRDPRSCTLDQLVGP
ncbi:MAG TPA: ATP-dependent DNA ligase [Acidimicrobiales bacterium]|nr:ATP-dependent DNA ligase [Acidimicrobiales bacterium]